MAKRDQPDHYSIRARREGFAARSVYKLQEIQQKHRVLRRGAMVLDIGAAPGSWSQFARSVTGSEGVVVAVDLSPLPALVDLEGIVTIEGDIYNNSVIEECQRIGPFNAILSDAAPKTTGNRSVDTARSAALVEHSLFLCESLLRPGGSFVAKLFQGGEEQHLLAKVRTLFDVAKLFKPKASRSESFEVFLIGKGYTTNT